MGRGKPPRLSRPESRGIESGRLEEQSSTVPLRRGLRDRRARAGRPKAGGNDPRDRARLSPFRERSRGGSCSSGKNSVMRWSTRYCGLSRYQNRMTLGSPRARSRHQSGERSHLHQLDRCSVVSRTKPNVLSRSGVGIPERAKEIARVRNQHFGGFRERHDSGEPSLLREPDRARDREDDDAEAGPGDRR